MSKKNAAYIRVSTQEQADFGFGLDVQKEKIEQYIKLFDIDMSNVVWYIDEGKSAKNLNRPQMKQLLKEINKGLIAKVIIYKLDRLSRSVIDTYELIKTFTEKDCSLVSVIDQIDIGSANGRMFVGMLAIIAQWERETISERTSDALREMAFQGKYPYGSTPYGYMKNDNQELEINTEEANTIMTIIEYLKETRSLKLVVERLNNEMIGGKIWQYQTVSKMLNKPLYRGHLETKKFTINNHHPAIISDQDFANIKKILQRPLIKSEKVKHTYIFKGKVSCYMCDELCKQSGTTKKNGDRYNYYRCPKCNLAINEDLILSEIKLIMIADYYSTNNKASTDNYKFRLKDLARKKEELHRSYLIDRIDFDFFEEAYKHIKLEETRIQSEIDIIISKSYSNYGNLKARDKMLFFADIYDKITVDLSVKNVIMVEKTNKQH